MTERDIENFRTFFADYVRSFYSHVPEDQKNITLKEEHSLLVCRIIRLLAGEQGLAPDKILIAETIGLFHDIGRFPQYARYRTFRDSLSVNHGNLGVEILTEKNVLGPLPGQEQRIVLNAVRFHNAFSVPHLPDAEDVFFLRLVRDADKLDIWRIFLGFFESKNNDIASAVGLGLPETPGYSQEAVACLRDRKSVALSLLKNMNDFKLTQLSWVYDLNFSSSFALLAENDFIRRLVALLPDTEEIREVEALLSDYVSRMRKAAPAERGYAAGRQGT
ncbi:MAG: HD domain-containing protein [Nitrospiraceae bacterium]|nr:HD domain-containing protein [Nitrospiraceae bacterium]